MTKRVRRRSAAANNVGLRQGSERMTRFNIIVAAFDGGEQAAEALRRRLASAWTNQPAPDISSLPTKEIPSAGLDFVDLAVLAAGRGEDPDALRILAVLEEAGVPVVALVDRPLKCGNPFEFAGALIELLEVDDALLCAKIQGMLHRQSEVRQLRHDVSIAQRFQGGLKGEITRMHEELQLAAMVQREFLPLEMPSLHGIDFAVMWRPANYVSGDIYDVSRLDADHVGVFIADAVGHGVPAALMTMVICRSLVTRDRTRGTSQILEPSEVLSRLNAAMIRRQEHTTRFATACYALINCRSRVVHFAGAGHPPPLQLSVDGSSRLLETNGGLLGVFEDERYDQIESELVVGDRLLLYSDGFEQAFPSTEADDTYQCRLPTTRYRREFEQLTKLPTPQDVIDALAHRVDDQIGSLHQVDDLTLICVHAGPLIPTAERRKGDRPSHERAVPDSH
ncbi:MAG: serine/threonine-protein phosphatase [Phycisphaerales bacterium]|nr:MAG: serine/threonine-protein phosphatase [Phycisphaerales bacterium]